MLAGEITGEWMLQPSNLNESQVSSRFTTVQGNTSCNHLRLHAASYTSGRVRPGESRYDYVLCGAVAVVMFTDCGDLDTESLMTGERFLVFLRSDIQYMLSNK